MAKSADEIIQDLKDHVYLEGSAYTEWFIGGAKDGKKNLFETHGIVQDKHWYFISEASSEADAKKVVDHYVKEKMDGGKTEAGGTEVYAYRKRDDTKP